MPIVFLAGVVCLGFVISFWHQQNRPGARRYAQGIDAFSRQQYGVAERDWKQGIQEDPHDPQCYVALGDYYKSLSATRKPPQIMALPRNSLLGQGLYTTSKP